MRAIVLAAAMSCLAGCFSSSTTSSDAGLAISLDAAGGSQPVGSPCDPSEPSPCVTSGDDCIGVYCDPSARMCEEYVTDAGSRCTSGITVCSSANDCAVGLACGFPIGGGCDASGSCVNLAVECQDDASACTTGGTACGCAGEVTILVPGYASGPTSSATPSTSTCTAEDGGTDAGGPADAASGG
jgi:hypothetical protein